MMEDQPYDPKADAEAVIDMAATIRSVGDDLATWVTVPTSTWLAADRLARWEAGDDGPGWTNEPPARSGHYWHKLTPAGTAQILFIAATNPAGPLVLGLGLSRLLSKFHKPGSLWCGPLTPPSQAALGAAPATPQAETDE
jgi:hypothetical protein